MQIQSTCSIDGCDGIPKARGYCSKHHWSWWKYGDPLFRPVRTQSLAERFHAYTKRSDNPADCWLWQSTITDTGYGQIRRGGKPRRYLLAHVVAWELADGKPVPNGLVICHTCDVRDCVRNDDRGTYSVNGVAYPRWGHLFAAPATANVRDMFTKGRHPSTNYVRGEASPFAKLTEADVRYIRTLESPNISALARQFPVSRHTIADVVRGRKWTHLL